MMPGQVKNVISNKGPVMNNNQMMMNKLMPNGPHMQRPNIRGQQPPGMGPTMVPQRHQVGQVDLYYNFYCALLFKLNVNRSFVGRVVYIINMLFPGTDYAGYESNLCHLQ